MDPQEIESELAIGGARELLESTNAAHLSYVAADGTPRVVPVGYFWTGEEFVISTAPRRPRSPRCRVARASLWPSTVATTPDQSRCLSIRGRAAVTLVDGVTEEYLAAARRQ